MHCICRINKILLRNGRGCPPSSLSHHYRNLTKWFLYFDWYRWLYNRISRNMLFQSFSGVCMYGWRETVSYKGSAERWLRAWLWTLFKEKIPRGQRPDWIWIRNSTVILILIGVLMEWIHDSPWFCVSAAPYQSLVRLNDVPIYIYLFIYNSLFFW